VVREIERDYARRVGSDQYEAMCNALWEIVRSRP
jgi:hypothetical protein